MIIKKQVFDFDNPLETKYLSHENVDFAFIKIPKNASSFVHHFFMLNCNWKISDFNSISNKKFLVILRDPIQRWVSGISQYFDWYHPSIEDINEELQEVISKKVWFDMHGLPQVNYLEGIDSEKCVFLYMDEKFEIKFYDFVKHNHTSFLAVEDYTVVNYRISKDNLGIPFIEYKNSSETSKKRKKIKNVFLNILNENQKFKDRIKAFYLKDYLLIENVKFYEAN